MPAMTLPELREEVKRLFDVFLSTNDAEERESTLNMLFTSLQIYHLLIEHCKSEDLDEEDDDLENNWLKRD
jgi:hypothetical protein